MHVNVFLFDTTCRRKHAWQVMLQMRDMDPYHLSASDAMSGPCPKFTKIPSEQIVPAGLQKDLREEATQHRRLA